MRKPNEPMGFEFTPHHFTTEKDLKEIIKAFNDAYEMAEEDIANGKGDAQRHQTIINEMDALFRARDTLRDMMDMDIENGKNE